MSETSLLEAIARDVADTKARLAGLDVHINNIVGPPSMEQRLLDYIDKRDDHGKKNSSESVQLMKTILDQNLHIAKLELEKQILENRNIASESLALSKATELTRKENHKDSEERHLRNEIEAKKITRLVYIGLGMVLLAQAYIGWAVSAK